MPPTPKPTSESPAPAPTLSPFTVLIDTREQTPYEFTAIRDRAPRQDQCIKVLTQRETLNVGDYAAVDNGGILPIRVERKSKADLFGTVGQGRERFRREMERAEADRLRLFLVVECNLLDCVADPPPHSELSGMIVVRTLESWAVRYGVGVWWCGSRRGGEQVTYRLLEFGVRHFGWEARTNEKKK